MTFLADLDAEGRVRGFYRREIHGDAVPSGAIEISDEVHAAWIADTAGQRWNGAALEACAPSPPPHITADQARAQRNALLAACDWTQLADAPLSAEARAAWAAYRAALRDVPAQPGFPEAIAWPAPPAGEH